MISKDQENINRIKQLGLPVIMYGKGIIAKKTLILLNEAGVMKL